MPLLPPPRSNVQRILADWEPLLAGTLHRWGDTPAALSAAFETHRRRRMDTAPERWLNLNPLYPGVADALRDCPYPFYIASSKKASRLVSLLQGQLGLEVEEGSPRLFASLLPPNEKKIEALRWVAAAVAEQRWGDSVRWGKNGAWASEAGVAASGLNHNRAGHRPTLSATCLPPACLPRLLPQNHPGAARGAGGRAAALCG